MPPPGLLRTPHAPLRAHPGPLHPGTARTARWELVAAATNVVDVTLHMLFHQRCDTAYVGW